MHVKSEQERLKSAISDCYRKSETLLADAEKFTSSLKVKADKSSSGANLLDFNTYETISSLTSNVITLCKTVLGRSIDNEEIIDRLLKNRNLLERKRPAVVDTKSELSFPLTAEDNDSFMRARPDFLLIDSDEEQEDNDTNNSSDEDEQEKVVQKNLSSRIVPLPAGEQENKQEHRRINRMKKRILQSSLVKDLRQQYSEAPEEFQEDREILGDGFERRRKEQQKYEEDYFIRLPADKRQKHVEKKKMERSGMDSLLSFGKYLMPNGDDQKGGDGSTQKFNNRKRKGNFKNDLPSKSKKKFSKKKGPKRRK